MDKNKYLGGQRQRRRFRVRKRMRGSAERPRLTVFRSHRNLACQIIDDMSGQTLVAVGTKDKEVQSDVKYGGNKAAGSAGRLSHVRLRGRYSAGAAQQHQVQPRHPREGGAADGGQPERRWPRATGAGLNCGMPST